MPENWNDLREQFALASADFLEVVSGIDTPRAAEPGVCGVWSVKEIVAHMTAWDWEAERIFRAFHAGNAETPSYDFDTFNAAAVEERRGRTWEQTRDELRRANMTFGGALANVSVSDQAADPRYQQWLHAFIEHYAEHAGQIRVWLGEQPT